MICVKIGDLVVRRKYKGDILFRIYDVKDNICYLEGVYIRLFATANPSDLLIVSSKELEYYRGLTKNKSRAIKKDFAKQYKHLTGKILHIDSDLEFLYRCNELYNSLGLFAVCVYLKSDEISKYALEIIQDYQIDVVVITGHDSYNNKGLYDLENYESSQGYINAVKRIRRIYSKDDVYIFSGACGSNFEALIASGANAASSPQRVNIDLYDPAICAIKASTTPFDEIISFDSIWEHSLTKEAGISGIESYGRMRILR